MVAAGAADGDLEVPWGEAPRLTVPRGTKSGRRGAPTRGETARDHEQRMRQVLVHSALTVLSSASRRRARPRERVRMLAAEQVAAHRRRVPPHPYRRATHSSALGPPLGTLSFNWRADAPGVPPGCHVVVHELCHLRVSKPLATVLGARRATSSAVALVAPSARLRSHGPELLALRRRTGSPARSAARGTSLEVRIIASRRLL